MESVSDLILLKGQMWEIPKKDSNCTEHLK